MAEVSHNVAGIAFSMGHTDLRTTSQYVHPPKRSGDKVTQARFSADCDYFRDYPEIQRSGEMAKTPKSLADTAGFEPATSASGGDETTSAERGNGAFSGARCIRPSAARRSWRPRNAIKPGTVPGSFRRRRPSSGPRTLARDQSRVSPHADEPP